MVIGMLVQAGSLNKLRQLAVADVAVATAINTPLPASDALDEKADGLESQISLSKQAK